MGASSESGGKPCICQVKMLRWPWKPTGRVEGNLEEVRCRICGRTRWRPRLRLR